MASLLNIGSSGLFAYQRALNTTGHNISNANTEGYSRQRTSFEAREPENIGTGWVGSGTRVSSVERYYDDFLATQVRNGQSATSYQETILGYASQVDNLLANPQAGLDAAMQDFYDAAQNLADDPTSMGARQAVLSESDTLASRFNYLAQEYESLRNAVNSEADQVVNDINSLTQSIAEINNVIINAESTNSGLPLDLLDQREIMLRDLSKLVGISVLEQDNGAYNVFAGAGQALVLDDDVSMLSTTTNPKDVLSPDISITVSSSTQVVTSHITGGKLGGLLEFRSGFLAAGQNQLGLAAAGFVSATNSQHQLGLDLLGQQGGNVFADISSLVINNSGNTGDGVVNVSFDAATVADLTSSDYEAVYNGGGLWTMTRLSDNFSFPVFSDAAPPVMDGLNLAFTAGAPPWVAGDSVLIQPMRTAAKSVVSLIDDPNLLAAAGPLRSAERTDANGNPLNAGGASITQPNIATMAGTPLGVGVQMAFTFANDADTFGNAGFIIANGPVAAPNNYILYDPTTSDRFGKSFPVATKPTQFSAFGDLTFEIKGTPVVGDVLLIEDNTDGTSDNRNMLALAEMQTEGVMLNGSASFQDIYAQLVSDVGVRTRSAEVNFSSQETLLQGHEESLLSKSGVNLDEEAANLMKFQQAYQASAQVISVAGTLFDTLLAAVRR